MKEFVEKLIQELKEESIIVDDDAGHRAVEIIEQLAEEYNNGWIPCSERLPEKPANYLVCSKGVVWMANYFNYTWWGVEKKIRWQDVEAWQPLPAPYQKGE